MSLSSHQASNESIGTTSTGLIDLIRSRDDEAWRRLVRLYGRLVYYWCASAGLGDADRADVFQEVFRAVDQGIGNFQRKRAGDSFRAWLRTITKSKIVDQYRRKSREPDGVGGSDTYKQLLSSPDQLDADFELADDESEPRLLVQEAIELIRDEFEHRTWLAFWRTAADGIPTAVVSEELGMSTAAVRKAKSRVLRRLRDEFAGLEDIDDVLGQQIQSE